jgi:hypothetical protein
MLADNATVGERGDRERVEDDRLRYAAAQRSDKRMFGSGRLALKTLWM